MSWSISVKTVGSIETPGTQPSHEGVERNFTVRVSPDDDIGALYSQIEGHTGLRASQQRLIYRGRLIGGTGGEGPTATGVSVTDCGGGEPKIKDISGLGDGQTIHLLRKREENGGSSPTQQQAHANNMQNGNGMSGNNNNNSAFSQESDNNNDAGSGAASLLAALLGLGSDDDQNIFGEMPDSVTRGRERQRQRNTRLAGHASRRSSYRLTAEDLVVPDPGSMEPVRQGLMTLHTILPHASVAEGGEGPRSSVVEANRRWYRGQWVDCRDTVNQWLEATIVDLADPDVVLPPQPNVNQTSRRRPARGACRPTSDSAVSSMDWDGRRRLLLEPCDEDDPENEGGELSGWRRRYNNDGVQLLLIHYNGWPHRWDEWIRSDSERIRPFRTRTRHPSIAPYVSPTPQSVFNEAPSTFIRHDEEEADRMALLPELSRVVSAVNDILAQAAGVSPGQRHEVNTNINNLPWFDGISGHRINYDDADNDDGHSQGEYSLSPTDYGYSFDSDDASRTTTVAGPRRSSAANGGASNKQRELTRRQLELLAPLLDRLGRTLTDAAPHVASLASTHPLESTNTTEESNTEQQHESSGSISGLFSLLSRHSRRNVTTEATGNQATERVNPDHMDFASGLVNTYRGEVRGGPRTRQDDGPGLLGAYLAAASLNSVANDDGNDNNGDGGNGLQGLGRLFRDRPAGGGGNGIDIHIHAIVTTPGVGGGAFGLGGGIGGGIGATTLADLTNPSPTGLTSRGLFSRRSQGLMSMTAASAQQDEDDLGLFSDLYTENPAPVNPTATSRPGGFSYDHGRDENGGNTDDMISSRYNAGRATSFGLSHTDSLTISPMRLNNNSNTTSSRQGRRTSWSSTSSAPRDRSASPSRRDGSALGRFFRRLSRRSNH